MLQQLGIDPQHLDRGGYQEHLDAQNQPGFQGYGAPQGGQRGYGTQGYGTQGGGYQDQDGGYQDQGGGYQEQGGYGDQDDQRNF